MPRRSPSRIARRAVLVLASTLLATMFVIATGLLTELAPPIPDALARRVLAQATLSTLIPLTATLPPPSLTPAAATPTSTPPAQTTLSVTPTSTAGLPTLVPSAQATAPTAAISPASAGSAVKVSVTGASRWVVIPRLVRSVAGENSRLIILNTEGRAGTATLVVRDGRGQQVATQQLQLRPLAQQVVRAEDLVTSGELTGSASLLGDVELAVAIQEERASGIGAEFAAVSRPSTRAGFPVVKKSATGATTSLVLHNVTDRATDVTLTYYPESGSPITGSPVSLPAFGVTTINLAEVPAVPDGFSGAALAQTADVAIAGTAVYSGPANTPAGAYAAFGTGSERLVLPNPGQLFPGATVALQNLSGQPVEVSIDQHRDPRTTPVPERRSLGLGASLAVPPPAQGQQWITVTGPADSELVAVIHAGSDVLASVGAETTATFLPRVTRGTVTVQNLGDSPTTVVALFSSTTGEPVQTARWSLEPGQTATKTFDELQVLSAFAGSVAIHANQPLGVVVR